MLPLLVSVLGREGDVSLASNPWVNEIRGGETILLDLFVVVHVPHADNEVTELAISLNVSVQKGVILDKVIESYDFLISEIFVCTVKTCEQIQEFKLSFVDSLNS